MAIRYVDSAVASSGNGLSWATAWKAISNITGLSAGDTVYFSGGASGKTYSISNWQPTGGTAGNPITYATGQDAGHTGMVTFSGSGNFLQGPMVGITINGEVSGQRRMTLSGYDNLFYSTSTTAKSVKVLYAEATNICGYAFGNGYEIGYCSLIAPLSMNDDSMFAHIGDGGSGSYTGNLIHHNYIQVWRIRQMGRGQDALKWVSNATVYNNTFVSAYNASYTGTQHNDGIQTGSGYLQMYNNYYEGFISYPMYFDGALSNLRIYNNVYNCDVADRNSIDWAAYAAICHEAEAATGTGPVANVLIANNTLIASAQGTGNGPAGIRWNNNASYQFTSTTNCQIVNNIMYGLGGWVMQMGQPNVVSNNIVASTTNVAFVNNTVYPNNNFRLTAAATAAINQGISPSYITSVFTTDADDYQRNVNNNLPALGAWDIGAYEYGASGGGTPPTGTITLSVR